jgi:hypothetical protein
MPVSVSSPSDNFLTNLRIFIKVGVHIVTLEALYKTFLIPTCPEMRVTLALFNVGF